MDVEEKKKWGERDSAFYLNSKGRGCGGGNHGRLILEKMHTWCLKKRNCNPTCHGCAFCFVYRNEIIMILFWIGASN